MTNLDLCTVTVGDPQLTLCQVRLGENWLVVSKMPKKGVQTTGFEPATLRCRRCGDDEDVGMQNCFSRRDLNFPSVPCKMAIFKIA